MAINCVRCVLSFATFSGDACHSMAVPLRVKFTFGSAAARLTKSSTTAPTAGSPPSRSYSDRPAIAADAALPVSVEVDADDDDDADEDILLSLSFLQPAKASTRANRLSVNNNALRREC